MAALIAGEGESRSHSIDLVQIASHYCWQHTIDGMEQLSNSLG